MTKLEIIANCGTLISAGSETTATLLSGATFLLLKNQEALSKVTNEVRDAFATQTDINFISVAQLPYLNACLKESLRLYPPVPGALPRRIRPEGDVINGQFVPENVGLTSSGGAWLMCTYRLLLVSTNGAHISQKEISKIPRNLCRSDG